MAWSTLAARILPIYGRTSVGAPKHLGRALGCLCIPFLTAAATGSSGDEDGQLCSAPQVPRTHSLGLAAAIQLKKPDSLRHLQVLVVLISWGACICSLKAEARFPSIRWALNVAPPGAGIAVKNLQQPCPASVFLPQSSPSNSTTSSSSSSRMSSGCPQASSVPVAKPGRLAAGHGRVPWGIATAALPGDGTVTWGWRGSPCTSPPGAPPPGIPRRKASGLLAPRQSLCPGGPGGCPCPWWPCTGHSCWVFLTPPLPLSSQGQNSCCYTSLRPWQKPTLHPETTPISHAQSAPELTSLSPRGPGTWSGWTQTLFWGGVEMILAAAAWRKAKV